MEMDVLYINVMDFGLRCAQRLKDPDGFLFGRFADRGFINDLPDLLQATMMMLMGIAVLVLLVAMRMAL